MYYFQITDKNKENPIGVYAADWLYEGSYDSDAYNIWEQGKRGGVKILKRNGWILEGKYITKDTNLMKEFMWVKLQAKIIT